MLTYPSIHPSIHPSREHLKLPASFLMGFTFHPPVSRGLSTSRRCQTTEKNCRHNPILGCVAEPRLGWKYPMENQLWKITIFTG